MQIYKVKRIQNLYIINNFVVYLENLNFIYSTSIHKMMSITYLFIILLIIIIMLENYNKFID